MNWQPYCNISRHGYDILVCVPGSTDAYCVVCWNGEGWEDGFGNVEWTDAELASFNGVMWCEIEPPPTSLCYRP